MKVPYTWLKEYVDTDLEPNELADRLTMAGLEVDRIERRWDKIITARIVHKEPVAGSDHLSATRVTTGNGRELSVVCGAPNIAVGDVVPLALPGAEMQTDDGEVITIGVTTKRGVLSEGMLCSPRELGLSSDHQGIYLLPAETPLGSPLVEVIIDLDIKAHRGDLFSITGIAREVAAFQRRRMQLPPTAVPEQGAHPASDLMRLTIEATDLCPRFTARVIQGVRIGPSPLWMVRRLAAAGVRAINNVVDISNYVMLELGQPLHTFDYDRVADHRLIVRPARPGERLTTLDGQERELTSDMLIIADATGAISLAGVMGGATSEVSPTTTNILLEAANWDPATIRRTSKRLGLRSEASSRFEKGLDPELARLGLDRAARLLAELAGGTVAPGVLDVYPHPVTPRHLRFSSHDVEWLLGYPVSVSEVEEALAALEFGVALDPAGHDMTVTVPTWRADVQEEADLVEEVARVLGYGRITGHIPSGPLPEPLRVDWFARQEQVRDSVAGAGCHEIVTYPLTSRAAMLQLLSDQSDVAPLLAGATEQLLPPPALPKVNGKGRGKGKRNPAVTAPEPEAAPMALALPPERMPAIVLANPLSANLEALRLTLLVSLMEKVGENANQGAKAIRLFEVGRRYIPNPVPGELPDERRSLAIALSGPAEEDWLGTREVDFFDLKAVIERLFGDLTIADVRYTPTQHPTFHPGRCALIELPLGTSTVTGGASHAPAGIIGEIHPTVAQRYGLNQRVYALEIDLDRLYAAAPANPRFTRISRFPALTRDLAVVVGQEVPAAEVAAAIHAAGGDLVRSVTLFDVYEGEQIGAGKRSLAFTIVYQTPDRTLSDADGDAERARVVARLKEQFGATIRE